MAFTRTVTVRATIQQVNQVLQNLPDVLTGRARGVPVAHVMQVRLGLTLLGEIKKRFVIRARGGTDDTGLRWAPLSPVTLRKRRRGKGNKFGDEILRDTGLLYNSLSPGVTSGTAQMPASVPKQIFRILPGEVTVGTNRKWCRTHHEGVPGRIPQRRLWPPPGSWSPSWWDNLLFSAQTGAIDIIIFLLRSIP